MNPIQLARAVKLADRFLVAGEPIEADQIAPLCEALRAYVRGYQELLEKNNIMAMQLEHLTAPDPQP